MIQRLVDNGHAYAAEGHVLFSVPSMSDYGRLSRRTRDELDRRRAGRGGALQEGPRRLRAVEALGRRPAGLGEPVGSRPAGLAHRVLGDERQASGRDLRHPCRRPRPHLPAPRERDRAEPQHVRPRHHGEVLDAQRLPEHLRREDEQVARQLLHRARAPGPVPGRGDPPVAAVRALPPAARLHA